VHGTGIIGLDLFPFSYRWSTESVARDRLFLEYLGVDTSVRFSRLSGYHRIGGC
jgi:hypothetical protein